MVMTVTTLISGDLIGVIQFAMKTPKLQLYMGIYTFIAYIAISVHMTVVKRFGGVTAVLVATVRKAMTLVLSFIIFPKKFSWFYVIGASLVLGGLTVSSLAKMNTKKKRQPSEKQLKAHQSDIELSDLELSVEPLSEDEETNSGSGMFGKQIYKRRQDKWVEIVDFVYTVQLYYNKNPFRCILVDTIG